MDIKKVFAVYFSPCDNVKKIVKECAGAIAKEIGCECGDVDFTLPAAREKKYEFNKGDVVVFGTPVYAGRIPNKILPFVQEGFTGNGAVAISMCSFGNRSMDHALAEISGELKNNGFILAGAAGIPSQHSFTDKLAPGRPNKDDLAAIAEFGAKKAKEISAAASEADIKEPEVPGEFPAPCYYTPLQADGSPAKFLKAVPCTDLEKCVNCGLCARSCPMGSIDPSDNHTITGVCIKCHACINKCPKGAKYFDDPILLSHVDMLVDHYASNKYDLLLN